MTFLTSKWMIAVYIILSAIIILYLTGRKSVHAEIIINTSPEEVWTVLMDEQGYKDWNPVLVPVNGEIGEGQELTYKMIEPDGKSTDVVTKVIDFKPNELLNQYGGTWGIITFDHKYILEKVEVGTKVTIHEDYRGIMVNFWNPDWVQTGYEQTLEGLKKRVEAKE